MYAIVHSVQQYWYDSLRSFPLRCIDANIHKHTKHGILRAATTVMEGCTLMLFGDELPRTNRAALLELVIYDDDYTLNTL